MSTPQLQKLMGITLVGIAILVGGCDVLKEPKPKVAKASGPPSVAPSTTPTGNAGIATASSPASAPIWKKQTVAGVTFEAPFEVTISTQANLPPDLRSQVAGVEAHDGGSHPLAAETGVRLAIIKMSGASKLASNMEFAMRQAMRSKAQRLGDPNPAFRLDAAHFGGASGFIASYGYQQPGGRFDCMETINAASGDTLWMIFAAGSDPSYRDSAKRIIASITIQP